MENNYTPLECDPVKCRALVDKITKVVNGLPARESLDAITALLIVLLEVLEEVRKCGLSADSRPEARVLEVLRNMGAVLGFNFGQYIVFDEGSETPLGCKE